MKGINLIRNKQALVGPQKAKAMKQSNFLPDSTRAGWSLYKQHSAFAFTLSRKPRIWGLSHSKAAAEAGMLWNISLFEVFKYQKMYKLNVWAQLLIYWFCLVFLSSHVAYL